MVNPEQIQAIQSVIDERLSMLERDSNAYSIGQIAYDLHEWLAFVWGDVFHEAMTKIN